MRTQRLSGAGKRMLSPVVLCCLWALALPAAARAQGFGTASCIMQSEDMGGMTVWQIKGTATVGGLLAVPNTTTVNVTDKFQKKAKGAANWATISTVTQLAPANFGNASIDTGFRPLAPAPAQGDQYRIEVSGTWSNAGPPAKQGNLAPFDSLAITPVS